MWNILAIIFGYLLGFPVSHYTAYLINNNEDCKKIINHKILSKRCIVISIINACLWFTIVCVLGMTVSSILMLVVASLLLALSVVDFAVYEIPPQFNVAIAIVGVICTILDYERWYEYVIGAFTVSGIFLLMALATKGRGMGGGDIKLMAATGLVLGWKKILFVMVIGAVVGVVIHSIVMTVKKEKSMLAFGPYLSLGVFIMILFGNEIVQWYIDHFLDFTVG